MEGLYLMHTREFIKSEEKIYKLGRSFTLDNRVKQYPKKSKIICMVNCENSILCEKELIKLFKGKFIQKLDYGTEYFEGDKKLMIREIFNFIDKFEENMKGVKKEVKKEVKKDDKKEDKKEVKKDDKKEVKKDDKNIIKIKKKNICPKCNHDFKYKSLLKTHFKNVYHCMLDEEEINNYFNNNSNINKCNNTCPDLISDKYKVTFNLSNNTQKTYTAIYYKKFGQLFFYPP